jgi:hypothetical protein
MNKHLIFAVDFDGTIVEHKFPKIGAEKPNAIRTLIDLQECGHKIIIWTCRNEFHIVPMLRFLEENGFKPDSVNLNINTLIEFAWPKILADVYIDDRSFPPFTNWDDVRKEFLK